LVFNAIDLDCNETPVLTRSDHWTTPGAEESFAVTVTKKPCELIDCSAVGIQDLYTCGCVALADFTGDLIDIGVTDVSQVRLDVGGQFTIRQFAPPSDSYE